MDAYINFFFIKFTLIITKILIQVPIQCTESYYFLTFEIFFDIVHAITIIKKINSLAWCSVQIKNTFLDCFHSCNNFQYSVVCMYIMQYIFRSDDQGLQLVDVYTNNYASFLQQIYNLYVRAKSCSTSAFQIVHKNFLDKFLCYIFMDPLYLLFSSFFFLCSVSNSIVHGT